MIVGILKEIKADENRVSLSPGGVEFMRQNGHTVLVEKNAGNASGFGNARLQNLPRKFLRKPK
jgi:alanine dehydrogenase